MPASDNRLILDAHCVGNGVQVLLFGRVEVVATIHLEARRRGRREKYVVGSSRVLEERDLTLELRLPA